MNRAINNAMQPTANSVAFMREIRMVPALRARRLMVGVRRQSFRGIKVSKCRLLMS